MNITMQPIGHVVCDRRAPDDDDWDAFPATIVLSEEFGPEAFLGLDAFSHVEILYLFHLVEVGEIERGARHPRGRVDWPKVGVFAQRGKGRPNRIGATICSIASVDGIRLHVNGLDAVDGAPILDIKPVMSGFLPRGLLREPDWAQEIMSRYW